MYRFIDFNNEKPDSMLLMELSDLAKTLSRDGDYEADFRVHSYLSRDEKKIYVSHFWNHRDESIMRAGLKSDVFLRALGNLHYTDHLVMVRYSTWANQTKIPRFAEQLFVLAEDLRIEELCKRERPGTNKEFVERRNVYVHYFASQLKANIEKNRFLDALFCLTYLLLNSESPTIQLPTFPSEDLNNILPILRKNLEQVFDARTTNDVQVISKNIIQLLEQYLNKDMINDYFHLYIDLSENTLETMDDLRRKDPLANHDISDKKATGDEQILNEEMKTWHRETSTPGTTFLQFDLDQGTQTDILANGAREGEPGDQALAIVQGSTQKSTNKDFSKLEEIGKKDGGDKNGDSPYGKENQYAQAIFIRDNNVNNEHISQYKSLRNEIIIYQKKLKKAIELTLEHKKINNRTHLQFGRLNKKLIPFFVEDFPKLFYKNSDDSNQLDAVFSLLIDCSASMADKMEETKKGIVLFHEALKSVNVRHEITGFWEDANDATEVKQPNYFQQVVGFMTSLNRRTGPEMMKLEAQEDNRDGFAIRVLSERLLERLERQKFLLIFSDGEPAAFGYDQNGIIDTHAAVNEARKRGIEVINIFLSNEPVDEEQRKVFSNIYGRYSIIAPSIEMLPNLLFPLLKKLLLKSL